MTPASTLTPYCDSRNLIRFVDWRIIADLVSDGDGPRPTRASLLDVTRDAGVIVFEQLLAASGELEAALTAGGKYAVTDLVLLTASMAGGLYLRRLCAFLAAWGLAQHREPGAADPEHVPGAKAALAVLEQLRQGETILPFIEASQAGGGPEATPLGESRVIEETSRVFPTLKRCW